ncbi:MAG: hypothetical protein DCC49_01275 [Acidobacteria bacterium]|nr:MAG: hypothetical protein DCC49_01275 [Acidobacteriota bacterium]
MAKKKQVKKRAKSLKSSAASGRSSSKKAPSGKARPKAAQRSTLLSRAGEVVWTRRPTGHLFVIAVVGALVLSLVAVLLVSSLGKPKNPLTERQKEAQQTMEQLSEIMDGKQWAMDELEALLGRPLPEGDSELATASHAADRWGQAFSYLKLKMTAVKVPEWLWYPKEFLPVSAVMYTEAAENIALLTTASPSHRPDLFAQAKRFVVLGKGAEASAFLLIRSTGDVPGPLTPREQYPLVADDVLAEFPDAPMRGVNGVTLPNPSAMAGVPGSQLPSVATQPPPQWSRGVSSVVEQREVTATNSAFCDVVIGEKDGIHASLETFLGFFAKFREIADDLARLTPPEGGLIEAAGTIRAYRSYEEAAVVGRILTSAPELAEKMRFKLFRVTLISGNQWTWVADIGRQTGVRFVTFPACNAGEEFRQWITLTPWDAREELKREFESTA